MSFDWLFGFSPKRKPETVVKYVSEARYSVDGGGQWKTMKLYPDDKGYPKARKLIKDAATQGDDFAVELTPYVKNFEESNLTPNCLSRQMWLNNSAFRQGVREGALIACYEIYGEKVFVEEK